MCGIVGAYSSPERQLKPGVFNDFLACLNHRGPDGVGSWEGKGIALGQRRLAIIDLSDAGRQPMWLQCTKSKRTLAIIFNGEIYNYTKLQQELRRLGHSFVSHSDTEVILHVYEEWGSKGFAKLRGMFALALWDAEREELVVARDRFGIKPLYYFSDSSRFVFSSEIKAFWKLDFIKKQIRQQALGDFLRRGYVPQPDTFYENISALEPGTYLKLRLRNSKFQVEQARFADLKDYYLLPKKDVDLERALTETKDALLDSVEQHLVADVEVGLFLSGGIDSSVILALMRELRHDKIKTVSAVFPGTGYDESDKVAELVERFDTRHLELKITGSDFLENLDTIFYHMDQPSIDGVNTYFVSSAAKAAGLKVVLSGLGGDELFYGYPSFSDLPKISRWSPLLRTLQLDKLLTFKSARKPSSVRLAKLQELLRSRSLEEAYLVYRANLPESQLRQVLSGVAIGQALKPLDVSGLREMRSLVSYFEMRHYLQNQLLRDADVFSMAHSIELRVPYVDSVLFETVVPLPDRYKIVGNNKKFLLKEVLKQGVSQRILRQKKQGFVLPLALWLKNEARELLQNELLQSELFQKAATEKLLQQFFAGQLHWSRIWSLFVLNRFVKNS